MPARTTAFLAAVLALALQARAAPAPQQPSSPSSGNGSPSTAFHDMGTQTAGVPTPEEAEVARRMDAAGDAFLASFLGPGRARVLVTVEGERSRTHTQTEIITPISLPPSVTTVNTQTQNTTANSVPQESPSASQQQNLDLPGYVQDMGPGNLPGLPGSPPAPKSEAGSANNQTTQIMTMPHFDFFQRDQEETSRVSGFIVKKLKVTCILDSKLPDAKAAVAAKLLPDLFHIDSSRGDELTIVRADMVPYWKTTLQSYIKYLQEPSAMRTELRVAAVALLIVLLALALYLAASRLVKRIASELSRLREERTAEQAALGQETPGEGLPELEGDGIPDLIEGETAEEGEQKPKEGETPALGRRFDFLSKKSPAELGKLLLTETPQDLALLFGYLTQSDPEMSTAMFSAMPQSRQVAVSRAMSGLTMADPERLAMVETRLRNIVDFGIHGAGRLGDILSRLPLNEREALLNDLMTTNPQAADEINRALFSFEDIAGLKEQDLRRLIMAVTYPDWGLALRGAPQELIDRVLEQLLPGTQNLIREAMETAQPRAKVLEARSKVLAQAYEMAQRGELALTKEGSSDLV